MKQNIIEKENFVELLRNSFEKNKEYEIFKFSYCRRLNFLQLLVLNSNREEVKKYLIENIDNFKNEIDYQNERGITALMIVCGNPDSYTDNDVIKTLLKAGANVNLKCNDGNTALIYSCLYSNIESTKILLNISEDIDINLQNDDGNTALMICCTGENIQDVKIAKLLLEKGVNVDLQDVDGRTPLMNTKDNIEIVKLLLKYGANVDIKDKDGRTAYINIFEYNHFDENFILEKLKLLSEYKANPNLQDNEGFTALMLSYSFYEFKNIEIRDKLLREIKPVKFLLSLENIDVNLQNNRGYTVLMELCEDFCTFNMKLLKILLKREDIDVELRAENSAYTFLKLLENNKYNLKKLQKYLGIEFSKFLE